MGQLMNALTHLAKCAFSDGLADHIVANKAAIGWSAFLPSLGRLLPVTLFTIFARVLVVGQGCTQRCL